MVFVGFCFSSGAQLIERERGLGVAAGGHYSLISIGPRSSIT